MRKTIIIFTLYLDNEYHYPSFVHFHAKEYVQLGYNVIVFAQKSVLPIVKWFKKEKKYIVDGVNVIVGNRLSVSGLFPNCKININGLLYYLSVKKHIKKIVEQNDVFFFDAHTFHCEGYTAYLLKKKYPKIKTTITFHGSDLEGVIASKIDTKRVIEASKYIDYFICVSDKLKKKIEMLDISNVKTIYNGINLFKLHHYPKEKTIISCGSLIESKNFGFLIDTFYEFYQKHSDYKFKIIGSGELKDILLKKINDYGLNNNVFLLGEMSNEDVYKEYEKASIFILVSHPEGFGIVYPEAMYCSCVTIGTKNEGIDGFIKNGVNGFLVNSDNKELLNLLEFIISNNCDKIIMNGQKDAQNLSWEKNCKEYLK